jgi:hypothetical protein
MRGLCRRIDNIGHISQQCLYVDGKSEEYKMLCESGHIDIFPEPTLLTNDATWPLFESVMGRKEVFDAAERVVGCN